MKELDKSLGYIRKRLEPYIETIDEYVASENQQSYYDVIKKSKRRGGYRFIYRCTNINIRSAHKIIYELLREYQDKVHESAHGFIKHRSTLSNARQHTTQKYLLHVDLKDFFDSILINQVEASLLRLGINKDVAEFLSKLITVDGVLRQGLHTSPDLSNHCLHNVDIELDDYANNSNFIYTRYGDDISFSGTSQPDKLVIRSAIEAEGFRLNEEKVKLQKRGSNQYVTGLTVFDSQPRIPRRFKKRLRLQLYYINKFGFEEHVKRTRDINRDDFESDEEYQHYLEGALYGSAKHIVGHVAYLNSVEGDRAKSMWAILNNNKIRDYFYSSPELLEKVYPEKVRLFPEQK